MIAYDTLFKKKVIVKSISHIHAPDYTLRAIQLQADILRRCDHPNIIKLHDVFEQNESLHIVFEYAEYGDLLELLNRKGAFSETDAAHVTKQLLFALQYLHESLHVIHW